LVVQSFSDQENIKRAWELSPSAFMDSNQLKMNTGSPLFLVLVIKK
jgi:hypothetical protein